MRAGTGFCFAALYMVIESWLNEKSTNETRGLVFSIYTIVNLTVITIGQMMLTLASPLAFSLFALASILVSLAAVPVALTSASAPQPPSVVRIRPRYLFGISPVGFVGCFAVGLANASFWSLGPIFAQREEGDVTAVAVFMSLTVIAGAVGQWPLGRLSDRMDRRKVIAVASIGASLSGVGLVSAAHFWPPGILVAAALLGFFAFPIYSLCAAHMNDHVEPGGFVESASGLLLIFSAGAVAGPVFASVLVRFYGVDSLFGFTAAVHLAIAVFAVYRMRRRAAIPAEERADFADSIRLAQTVSTIDPLSHDETAENPAATAGGAPERAHEEAASPS
jgi:MFS family permease